MKPATTKYCINCGKPIPINCFKCPHCFQRQEHEGVSKNHNLNSHIDNSSNNIDYVNPDEYLQSQINNPSVSNNTSRLINGENNGSGPRTLKKQDTPVEVITPKYHDPYSSSNENFIEDEMYYKVDKLNEEEITPNIRYPNQYSNVFPIRRLFLLMIFTFGFYGYYWFYKNCKLLKEEYGQDISPGIRTFIFIFIPIGNWIVFYYLIKDYQDLIEYRDMESYSPVMNLLIYMFLPILSFWTMINVQESINDLWRYEQSDLKVRRSFKDSEIFIMIIVPIIFICLATLITFFILANVGVCDSFFNFNFF